jgi:serine protease
MKKFLFLALSLLFAAWAFAQKTPVVANQVLVQLTLENNPDLVVSEFIKIAGNSTQFRHEKLLSKTMRIHLFSFDPAAIQVMEVVAQLGQTKGVEIAQPNHILQERQIPNDSFFGQQWHHVESGDHDIDSDLAWDVTTGGVTAFGDDIVVCVVENGGAKWDQADIVDNHWVNTDEIPNNGIDDDGNGYVDDYDGWNISTDTDNLDTGNHGTQVSSMIGAKGNNALGITGVNWDVKIMQIQMGGINENNVIESYEYPLVMRKMYNQSNGTLGAFVVATNSSWGVDGGDPAEAPLWCAMYDSLGYYGVLSAGSTANNNVNVDAVGDLPTACPSDFLISVTATNDSDVRTFSGYGITTIDIGAPGEDVYLAGNNNYNTTSGTSFAGPCVAGAVALLYSAPCTSLMEIAYADPATAAMEIKNYLMNGVDLVNNLSDEVVSGGRLNVNNSLQLLLQNCSEGACVTPFNVSAAQIGQTLDYTISWGTTASMISFDIQYNEVGSDALYYLENVGLPPYTITGLNTCTAYQVQIIAHCGEESSLWSAPMIWTTDGCCEHPSASATTIIGDTYATVSWDPVLAATGYNIIVTENGNGFFVLENVTGSSVDLTGLNPCSTYTVSVSSICEGIGGNTANITFNTMGCGSCQDLTYCDVTADSGLEHIAEVTVDSFTRASGDDGGYILIEDSDIILNNEWSYPIALTPGFSNNQYSEYFKVWIDYNSNGEFETSELVFESSDPSPSQVSGSFTVPPGLIAGVIRMRVAMRYNSAFGGGGMPVSCGDGADGEIEDYCVTLTGVNPTVTDLRTSTLSIYPNPAEDLIVVPSHLQNARYTIYDQTGRVCLEGQMNQSQIRIDALASGLYTLRVADGQLMQQGQFIKQ